jgi:uncharacterized membrane protein YgcG
MYKLLMLCAAVALLSTPAQARCRDDIQDMKPRLDRIKNAEPQRYILASRWWGQAIEAEPGSELECSNFIERARKALTMPMEANDCTGANAQLMRCNQGGNRAAYGGPGAAGAGTGFAFGGGGGGGGAGGGGAAAAVPFTPPGSVKSSSTSPER